jgi:hypothetical protein
MAVFKLNGSVWDKDSGKIIARSSDGIFETTDEVVIKKLTERGYTMLDEKPEPRPPVNVPVVTEMPLLGKKRGPKPKEA